MERPGSTCPRDVDGQWLCRAGRGRAWRRDRRPPPAFLCPRRRVMPSHSRRGLRLGYAAPGVAETCEIIQRDRGPRARRPLSIPARRPGTGPRTPADRNGDLRRGHIGILRFTEDERTGEIRSGGVREPESPVSTSPEDRTVSPKLAIHRHSLKLVAPILKKSAFVLMTDLPIRREACH